MEEENKALLFNFSKVILKKTSGRWRTKCLHAEPTSISYQPARFTGYKSCYSGNISFRNCHVTSCRLCDQMSCGFKDVSLSL